MALADFQRFAFFPVPETFWEPSVSFNTTYKSNRFLMDRFALYSLLSHHVEGIQVDAYSIRELYAATLADINEKVSNDEMRRLLLVGSYLFHHDDDVDGNELDQAPAPAMLH